jgi:hypothetical protein
MVSPSFPRKVQQQKKRGSTCRSLIRFDNPIATGIPIKNAIMKKLILTKQGFHQNSIPVGNESNAPHQMSL